LCDSVEGSEHEKLPSNGREGDDQILPYKIPSQEGKGGFLFIFESHANLIE
jgi:hypothetical protein